MRIAVIGVNHTTASIKIREKLSFTDTQKIEVLNQLLDYEVKESVILSTCNRSEIYIVTKYIHQGIECVKRIYEVSGKDIDLESLFFVKTDEEALIHLYNVASGLDSIVIGEDQILGQVKDAHEFALNVGSSGKILNKCFREAVTTAKMIKSKIKISEHPLSISYIGVKFIKEKIGTLEGKDILLIGAGKMNQLTLNHIKEENVGRIYLANRTSARAQELQMLYPKLEVIPFESRYDILPQVDLVVTSTASPHLVIKEEHFQSVKHQLHILDIALPRDVDEAVGQKENVTLYDIDDLKTISNQNNEKRMNLAKQAEQFIDESVSELIEWIRATKTDPTIQSLHEKCYTIQEDTMQYIRKKVKLNCKEEKIVEKMIMSSLKRLIREPIGNLKEVKDEHKQEEYIKLIEELFEL